MTANELLQWRKGLGMSQRDAAKSLGMALTSYQEMERGTRYRGGVATISRRTELACRALTAELPPEKTA